MGEQQAVEASEMHRDRLAQHHSRFVPLGLVLVAALWRLPPMVSAWRINRACLLICAREAAPGPDRSPLLGIGLRVSGGGTGSGPPGDARWKSDLFNVNWGDEGALSVAARARITRLLTGALSCAPDHQAILLKLARLQLLSGRYDRALDYFGPVLAGSRCVSFEQGDTGCYYLWIGMGDALDGLGKAEDALAYYRAANWFGRREAACHLALEVAERAALNGDEDASRLWVRLANQVLPSALAVRYVYDPTQTALCQIDQPQALLAVRADPRLERRTADASVGLLRSGVWDSGTFDRVLGARAWSVDRHTFDYGEYKNLWVWTCDTRHDPARMRALAAYFERLAELVPQDAHVWFYLAEVEERLGMCSDADLHRGTAIALAPALSALDARPRRVSDCRGGRGPGAPVAASGPPRGFVLDMERWISYGQAVGLTAAPSSQYGYGRHATWVWGPDTRHRVHGAASFRADCLWYESPVPPEPVFLSLAIVEENTGQVRSQTVPAGHQLQVSYWWQATDNAQLRSQLTEWTQSGAVPVEPIRSDSPTDEMGWAHTLLTVDAGARERVVETRWQVSGCGTVWLDHITVSVTKE